MYFQLPFTYLRTYDVMHFRFVTHFRILKIQNIFFVVKIMFIVHF